KSNRLPEVPRVSRSSHVSGDAAFVTLKYAPISDGARPRSQMRTSSIPPLNRSRLAAAYRPIASQYPLHDKGRPVRIRGTATPQRVRRRGRRSVSVVDVVPAMVPV